MDFLLKIFKTSLVFIFLTIATQIGGMVYLLNKGLTQGRFKQVSPKRNWFYRQLSLLVLLSIFSFILIPSIAPLFGRTALPVFESRNLKPASLLTCFMNRHYVRPVLKEAILAIAESQKEIPLIYLDANFPFFDRFPLFPHLSHHDGKKLDLAFIYKNKRSGKFTSSTPSLLGYGYCEGALAGEQDQAANCKKKGYWQYSLLKNFVRNQSKNDYQFHESANKELLTKLANHPSISKIFIEPHLKTRMSLYFNKIRFHGCQAVRHDDHIHIQI